MPARTVAIATTLAALMACSTGPDSGDLRAAKARWADTNSQNYEMTVQRLCFCGSIDPIRIRVEAGRVVSRTNTVTSQPLDAGQTALYPDVPGLFDLVEDAYHRAFKVAVTFDAQYGFPQETVIDYIGNAVDDELTLRVTAFTSLPLPQS